MLQIIYHHPAERALAAILGRAPKWAELYKQVGDAVLWQVAQENRVAPIVAHALQEGLGSAEMPAHWSRAHEETYDRISAYLTELDRIAARLADQGVPLVVLKNGGIARGFYPCPGCCPMGDLDVLVEKRHFRQAHQILLHEGYHFEFRGPLEEVELGAAEKSGGAEYWRILPNGEKLWFELQWRPVAGRWIRPDQEPSAEELVARSAPIPGTAARLLAAEDNLLQVALHTAKHSYVRAPGFRLHLDVERLVRYQTINWEIFLSRALALQVKTPVYFSLAIPKALFDTPIPDEVLRRLRPPAWKERLVTHWLERIGLFNPDERKFSNLGFILFAALLYDDLRGLWRAIFPDSAWMRQRYGFRSSLLLPAYHARRLVDLTLRRTL
jgi:hypothetical protein